MPKVSFPWLAACTGSPAVIASTLQLHNLTMQPSAPPPPSASIPIGGNFSAGGGGGAAGGGAPSSNSVVGSPFEFLDDLKRDRSNSLETLHHLLRGDELMRAAVAMEASTPDDGSYGALGGVDKRARAGSTPSMTGMFVPSHFPMGFDLASPQLTPHLTHMTAPSDYLRRDSIESLVGLGAPLSGLRRDSTDGSGAHRRDSLEGLMFPGDHISDSPPAFNRSFDLYPRHGFGAVYEDVPFMDPNSPALHAMGPGDDASGLRSNMDTMLLESPMMRGMMFRMQGAAGMRGSAAHNMHHMHALQQMGYPQGMPSMHDLQLQQHYAMHSATANPIPPPVPLSLSALTGAPQIPLVKVEINRGHDSDGDSPPNASGGAAGGPERRLSHKEVEQRRREKAKQCVHACCACLFARVFFVPVFLRALLVTSAADILTS